MFCRKLNLIEFHTMLCVFPKLYEVVYLGSSRNKKIWGELDCTVWRVYGQALRPECWPTGEAVRSIFSCFISKQLLPKHV